MAGVRASLSCSLWEEGDELLSALEGKEKRKSERRKGKKGE
jgi:hypothetical protein